MQYLGQYLSCYIQTWHDGRLMDAVYAHAHVSDLDLDVSGLAKATKSALNALGKSANVTLTLQMFMWLDQLVSFCGGQWC